MSSIPQFFDIFLHIDLHLVALIAKYGVWTYLILSVIILFETGFVLTPFLPGDSLLFALGAIVAQPEHPLRFDVLFALLGIASILGNQMNYLVGRMIGPRIFKRQHSYLMNQQHLTRATIFYEKHGFKTIILARFIPIIRTFAPFVAGIGQMNLLVFSLYNVISGVAWVGCLLGLGYWLGGITIIKEHFSLMVYGIILISLVPSMMTLFYQRVVRYCAIQSGENPL